MTEEAYDAIVIGAGTKSLFTAMYLTRYAGMSVAVFDGRHDYCAGLDSNEAAGAGVVGDNHASNFRSFYFAPIFEDFPDFASRGAELVHHSATLGVIDPEDQSSWAVHHELDDPTQERTITNLAEFSGDADAETYRRLWEDMGPGTKIYEAFMQSVYSPPPSPDQLDPFDRALREYASRDDAIIDHRWLHLPPYQAARELWRDDRLVSSCSIHMEAFGSPFDLGASSMLLYDLMFMPSHYIAKGGSRNIPRACVSVIESSGGTVFSGSRVQKILVSAGRASGVQLADGSTVRARKLVVSGVNPLTLVRDLLGPDQLSPSIIHKVSNLHSGAHLSTTWYTWAMTEQPQFYAAEQNPVIQDAHWLSLGPQNYDSFRKHLYDRLRGVMPEMNGHAVVWGRPTIADGTRAPDGTHVFCTELKVASSSALTEREWMEYKRSHAEAMINEVGKYASGMEWDSIVGYLPITPYDTSHTGNFDIPGGFVDSTIGQSGKFRPIAELAQYRTPIAQLYCTGQGIGNGRGAGSSCEGYAAYKAIADDMDLPKPWLEKGRAY